MPQPGKDCAAEWVTAAIISAAADSVKSGGRLNPTNTKNTTETSVATHCSFALSGPS